VKPVPDAVAELIVTAALPVDDKTTDCVAEVPTVTLPNATLFVLVFKIGPKALSCREKVFDAAPALAVSVAA
jgi:hypothetical protein